MNLQFQDKVILTMTKKRMNSKAARDNVKSSVEKIYKIYLLAHQKLKASGKQKEKALKLVDEKLTKKLLDKIPKEM